MDRCGHTEFWPSVRLPAGTFLFWFVQPTCFMDVGWNLYEMLLSGEFAWLVNTWPCTRWMSLMISTTNKMECWWIRYYLQLCVALVFAAAKCLFHYVLWPCISHVFSRLGSNVVLRIGPRVFFVWCIMALCIVASLGEYGWSWIELRTFSGWRGSRHYSLVPFR